jgi:hypothetical protein
MSEVYDHSDTTSALVGRFAKVFNERYVTSNGTGSALGLWLLYALLAPASMGSAREGLEAVLGTDADDAYARATALLANPHPAIASALVLWYRKVLTTDSLSEYVGALPEVVAHGEVPSQKSADLWTKDHTLGLIESFPIAVENPEVAVILASALATKVSWNSPLDIADATWLGGEFGDLVLTALLDYTGAIYDTEAAGLVAVHAKSTQEGLHVYSVIADESVDPTLVHAAAHEVSSGVAPQVSLFDLELEGHAWNISEYRDPNVDALPESYYSYLVAWLADSTRVPHDLIDAPGMSCALETLDHFVIPSPKPNEYSAVQAATSEFTRYGFSAAAITTSAISGLSMPRQGPEQLKRRATLRFNRPYAVLAVAASEPGSPWSSVPVFSAWVTDPQETPIEEDDRASWLG